MSGNRSERHVGLSGAFVAGSSVASEAAWGRHALEFGEIEFADSLEGLGQRAVVLVGRQRAIPLMTMTSARVSYLYDLMDAAYDAAAIHDQSRALGHAPIVDRNFRADHEGKAEWGREVERLKLIHMSDFDDLIYDFRTMAERVNARLKDEFGQISPRPRRSQGQMPSHVRHRRARRRSDHPCRRLQDRPCLTHPASPPPGPGKFTSLRVFCKKLTLYRVRLLLIVSSVSSIAQIPFDNSSSPSVTIGFSSLRRSVNKQGQVKLTETGSGTAPVVLL